MYDPRDVQITFKAPEPENPSNHPCKYGDLCIRCPWQDMDIDEQRARKRTAVIEMLGGLPTPAAADQLVSDPVDCGAWGTDNYTAWKVFGYHRLFKMGFEQEGTEKPVLLNVCKRISENIEPFPEAFREGYSYLEMRGRLGTKGLTMRYSEATDDLEVAIWTLPGHFPNEVVTDVLGAMTGASSLVRVQYRGEELKQEPEIARIEVFDGDGVWHDEVAGETFTVSAPSFWPENSVGASKLVELAYEWLSPSESDTIAVLKAGVGLFAVPLARKGAGVLALEDYPTAKDDLVVNIEAAGLNDKVTVLDNPAQVAGSEIAAAIIDLQVPDVDEAYFDAVIAAAPAKVALVSYDLPVLEGGLTLLVSQGAYEIEKVVPVDLYPQTERIAAITFLTRK